MGLRPTLVTTSPPLAEPNTAIVSGSVTLNAYAIAGELRSSGCLVVDHLHQHGHDAIIMESLLDLTSPFRLVLSHIF